MHSWKKRQEISKLFVNDILVTKFLVAVKMFFFEILKG